MDVSRLQLNEDKREDEDIVVGAWSLLQSTVHAVQSYSAGGNTETMKFLPNEIEDRYCELLWVKIRNGSMKTIWRIQLCRLTG